MWSTIMSKKNNVCVFSFNICLSIFYHIYIHTREETASCARVYSDVTRKDAYLFLAAVMRRTLEITSHLLTYRERIYARIHFGAHVHTAARRTEIRIRIREISGSFRCSPDR